MKILWLILLIGLAAAEVSKETKDQLIQATSDALLPKELVELWNVYKTVEGKLEKFDEEVDCNSESDEIVKSATKVSPDFGEKTKNMLAYFKKKYDALNPDGKKFLDELRFKLCTLLKEDDTDEDDTTDYESLLSATTKKYLALSEATRDSIEAQFPIITLAKFAYDSPPPEKVEAAIHAIFPGVVGDFLISILPTDHRKIFPLFNCSTGSIDEFFKRAKDVYPDFADKSKKLYDFLKKKYDALGPDGKKFFDEMKPKACDLMKTNDTLRNGVKDFFMSANEKYLELPIATRTEINKQFPAIALANAAYNYNMEAQSGSKFSPKFRRF